MSVDSILELPPLRVWPNKTTMDGFKREGRKTLQYVAALDDKTNNVTVDDIKKEMFVREMPTEI